MSIFSRDMEVHILILSTMNVDMTREYMSQYELDFDSTEGTICRLRMQRDQPMSVSLWVCCQHPVVELLAGSFVPHMDACICLYHDHDGLSCVRIESGMKLLQEYHQHIFMMATILPTIQQKHSSRVRHYYNENGFEIRRLTQTLHKNVEEILKLHLQVNKTL